MEKQEIQANTFTPIYDPLEDRIRLIINYKELNDRIDFMITRSFIVKLIYMIEEYIDKNFLEKEKPKEQEKTADKYSYQTEGDYIDLIVKEELLQEVNLTLLQDKENLLFTLSSKSIVAKAVLNKELLSLFVENLKKSIPKYEWGISL